MSTLQTPKEIIDSLETLLDSALEHASHGWRALEKGFLYCPTCEWFDGIAQEGTQSEKWAVCPQCSSLVFRVRVGTLADPDQWPPTTEALVGTAPYHIAALIQKVHDAYQLVLGERMRHSGEPIQGLKPIPEPTFTTKYLQEQEDHKTKPSAKCTKCSWAGLVAETDRPKIDGEPFCPQCGALVQVLE